MEFKEGCVTIKFESSGYKQCVTFIIDFGAVEISPREASHIVKQITAILRKELNLKFPKIKEL